MKRTMFAAKEYNAAEAKYKLDSDELRRLISIQAEVLAKEFESSCLDVKQLQEALGVGESNVYKLLRDGSLPHRKIGKRLVVPVAVLANFLILEKSA